VAKLDDAFARLNSCGAEPALVDLCKWCLQAESKDRPKNADVVVVAVAVLRTEAERRARQAEVDRVRAEGEREAAEAQSFAFRKQRQLQLALLLGVLFLVAVGTSFALYRRDVQTAQERAENELLLLRMGDENRQQIVSRDARVGVTANLKLATDLRKQYKFKQAEVALAQAAELARKVNIQDMRRVKEEVVQAQRELTFVVRLDDIRYRKWVWHAEEGGKGRFLTKHTAGDYRAAFVAFNLDLTALEPPVAATYIAAREAHREIVAAVDDWALHEPDAALCARLLDVARLTAPDPWLDKLRNPKLRQDPVALDKMATELDMTRVPPSVLATLATLMERQTLDPTPLLVRARSRYPDEFELAFQQGLWSLRFGGQGIGALEAARALRPDNLAVLVNLGGALFYGNKLEEARIALDRAIELAPQSADAHRNLGTLHTKTRDRTGAMRAFDTAISLDPQDVFSRISRGLLHLQNNEVEPALLLGRAAVAIDPLVAEAHALVGFALASKGDFSGARAAFAEVGRLDPKFAAQLPRIPFPVAPPPRPK
jgi:tetratricopeptide (TPR) repeat protein